MCSWSSNNECDGCMFVVGYVQKIVWGCNIDSNLQRGCWRTIYDDVDSFLWLEGLWSGSCNWDSSITVLSIKPRAINEDETLHWCNINLSCCSWSPNVFDGCIGLRIKGDPIVSSLIDPLHWHVYRDDKVVVVVKNKSLGNKDVINVYAEACVPYLYHNWLLDLAVWHHPSSHWYCHLWKKRYCICWLRLILFLLSCLLALKRHQVCATTKKHVRELLRKWFMCNLGYYGDCNHQTKLILCTKSIGEHQS